MKNKIYCHYIEDRPIRQSSAGICGSMVWQWATTSRKDVTCPVCLELLGKDTRTAEEKIEHIRAAMHDCQAGKISIEAFAVIVGTTVEPVPPTDADFEWARNKARELGLSHLVDTEAKK